MFSRRQIIHVTELVECFAARVYDQIGNLVTWMVVKILSIAWRTNCEKIEWDI